MFLFCSIMESISKESQAGIFRRAAILTKTGFKTGTCKKYLCSYFYSNKGSLGYVPERKF